MILGNVNEKILACSGDADASHPDASPDAIQFDYRLC